jgi:hypothetical protein
MSAAGFSGSGGLRHVRAECASALRLRADPGQSYADAQTEAPVEGHAPGRRRAEVGDRA